MIIKHNKNVQFNLHYHTCSKGRTRSYNIQLTYLAKALVLYCTLAQSIVQINSQHQLLSLLPWLPINLSTTVQTLLSDH